MIAPIFSAIEALGSTLPVGLGATIWLGSKLGPELVGPLVFSMLLGVALTNWLGANSSRPMVYGVRIFEVSILVGFIDSVGPHFANWGLTDTATTRITLVLAVGTGAALLQLLFYAFRWQRVTQLIPAPVFAGFLNATALVILISQVSQAMRWRDQAASLALESLGVALLCLVAVYSIKRLRPDWPIRIFGLLAAAALGWLFATSGQALPALIPDQLSWALPVQWVDFSAWFAPQVHTGTILKEVAIGSALLAIVMFLNTVTAAETLSQIDDKRLGPSRQMQFIGLGRSLAAALGSLPLSGSAAFSLAGMRTRGWGRAALCWMGVLALALYASTWLALIPAAAVVGLMVFEAYALHHAPSRVQLLALLRHPSSWRALDVIQRGDLMTVALVVATGVVFNMVAALVVGIVCGLSLFALRNGKSPILEVQRASTLRSYCVRSNVDSATLDRMGTQIACVRLKGALFFGVAAQLREDLESLFDDSRWVVIDWSRVLSSDTTVQNVFERLTQIAATRNVSLLHCARAGDAAAFIDLDRALECAEDQLLATYQDRTLSEATSAVTPEHPISILRGLNAADQDILFACFQLRELQDGEYLFHQGDISRELHVVMDGSINIVLGAGTMRIAAVRQGATLGEMAFLDGTLRFADGVAMGPVKTCSLTRQAFDELARHRPDLTQHLLFNLCSEIAERLRAANLKLYKFSSTR